MYYFFLLLSEIESLVCIKYVFTGIKEEYNNIFQSIIQYRLQSLCADSIINFFVCHPVNIHENLICHLFYLPPWKTVQIYSNTAVLYTCTKGELVSIQWKVAWIYTFFLQCYFVIKKRVLNRYKSDWYLVLPHKWIFDMANSLILH